MYGIVTIVVGEMGSGKSEYLKNFIRSTKKKNIVYGLLRQNFEKLDFFTSDIRTFVRVAVTRSNTLFIIDEGKTALPKKDLQDYTWKKNSDEKKLLVWLENSRKLNNAVFISFKTLQSVPLWLIGYSNYLTRFNSRDQMQYQKVRFKDYPQIVKSLISQPKMAEHCFVEIKIN